MANLDVRVVLRAVDEATRPLRNIVRGLRGLATPAKVAGVAIADLGRDFRRMALLGGAAITAASWGLYRLVRRTTDAGDAALLASQKTGVAVESWQRLAYWASMSGVETEGLNDSLKFLNQSIDAAGRGSRQDARAFALLGVSIRDLHGKTKPTEALLIEVADRFAAMEDGAVKTAIAMALFGRSGVEMIPALNEGGEAIRRWGEEAQAAGLVMSRETAQAADEFNDSLDRLKGGLLGIGNSVVSGLLPQLNQLIASLRTMLASNRPEIVAQMSAALKDLAAAAPSVIAGIVAIISVVGDLARLIGPAVKVIGGFSGALDILAGLLIGRVAVAIWMAVKAVVGLNAAMWANPVGLVIAGIAALVFAGWLLYRNWSRVVGFLKAVWSGFVDALGAVWNGAKAVFRTGIAALWQMMPVWLRMILRGAAFTLKVVSSGFGSQPPGGGGGGRPSPPPTGRPPAPRPNIQPGRGGSPYGQVGVDVRVHSDGRAPTVQARSTSPQVPVTTGVYRGGNAR